MNAVECVHRVVEALDALAIPFMVVGSFSSNVYGMPRSTKDVDFVIHLGNRSITPLATALGDEFALDPQMGFESVTGTTAYRLAHRSSPFVVELFLLSDDPHDQARFANRIAETIGGRPVFVPKAEDVVITKLRWAVRANRKKDNDDVQGILEVQSGRLDLEYIRHWADRHGSREAIERMLLT